MSRSGDGKRNILWGWPLHSVKRRHDMIESDSNYGQTKIFLTMYLRILPINLSLCRLVVRLYLDWKVDLFSVITLGHSLRSQRSACKLKVPEKKLKLI